MQRPIFQGGNNIEIQYQKLIDAGLTLRVDGNTLLVKSQRGVPLADEFASLIRQYKPGLIAFLEGKRVNNFQESLEKGDNPLVRPFLEAVYKEAFYNFVGVIFNDSGNSRSQKLGCDAVVYLTSDRVERVDHKIRYTDYGDIALEYISSTRSNTPGWMEKDLGINYLNYVVYPSRQAFLFPWQTLKKVWLNNKKEWFQLAKNKQDGFFIAPAPNDTYTTLSCCVPTNLLIEKIKEAIIVTLPKDWNHKRH